ncbi:TPA: hypothetical protein ACGD7M_001719 [Serratia marcescens]
MWYTTGKITVTNKSANVTATGTQWSVSRHGVLPGMIFIGPDGKLYEIQRVDSDTSLTLSAPYSGPTAKDQTYAIITTYEGDLTQFSAKFSNLMASFGGNRQDLLNWLTAKGDVGITKDDGSKLTVPGLDKINQKASLATDAGFGAGPIHTTDAFSKDNKSSIQRYTVATVNRPGNVSGAVISMPVDGGPSCAYFAISTTRQSWVGSSTPASPGAVSWSKIFSDIDKPTVEDIPNLKDWGLTKAVTAAVRGDFGKQMKSRRGYVATDPLGNPFKDAGTYFLDTRSWAVTQAETDDSYRTVQTCFGYGANGNQLGKIAIRGWTGSAFTPWLWMWSEANTTVDSNGFIKKASPIVKLFRDGTSELNDESHGVTTERVSEGIYRVSGTLGFNADAQWGGPDGGIEVPLDRNKQPLIWVDYKVEPTGDLLIKTYHRTHPAAPAFARNEVLGYDEGMPIDIPDGRWVDLRVEMPVREVEEAPEAVEETAALENVNVDPI